MDDIIADFQVFIGNKLLRVYLFNKCFSLHEDFLSLRPLIISRLHLKMAFLVIIILILVIISNLCSIILEILLVSIIFRNIFSADNEFLGSLFFLRITDYSIIFRLLGCFFDFFLFFFTINFITISFPFISFLCLLLFLKLNITLKFLFFIFLWLIIFLLLGATSTNNELVPHVFLDSSFFFHDRFFVHESLLLLFKNIHFYWQ